MSQDFSEIINKFITQERFSGAQDPDKFLETHGTPGHIDEILSFYEQHEIHNDNRTDGLAERRKLKNLLGAILKNGLCREDGSSILHWIVNYDDAWEALTFTDLMANEDYEKFGDDESSVLHLLFSREDIDFKANKFLIKTLIHNNLGLFFKPNENNISPYQVLKNNKAMTNDLLQSDYKVSHFFEEQDGLNDMGLSGQWQGRWDSFLSMATDEMIQFVLNENVSLILPELDGSMTLYDELDHSKDIESLMKMFKKTQETGKKKHKYSDPCNKMVEQSLIYMADLLAEENQDDEDTKKRLLHVENALMAGYFKNEYTLIDLKNRLNTILKENPEINQGNLKKVVGLIENRFSKKYEEISKSIRKYAIISTVLSILLIGIPFAIYYWLQYKKSWQEAPVHIFHLPVSTYEKIKDRLNRDDPEPAVKVISDKDNIKRTVQVLDDTNSPYFEAENLNDKTLLKVVCAAGDQTKRFKEDIKDLPFLERFTVTNVL